MNSIDCVYFSPTENSKKIVCAVATGMGTQVNDIDITLPFARNKSYAFTSESTIILGVPVYAGRIPRFIASFIKGLKGNEAKAVAIVTYGNRAYEDALLELTDLLTAQGFKIIAAGAFVGEHSSTELLATNRPDADDLRIALDFGKRINKNADGLKVQVPGNFPYVQKENPLPPLAPETNSNCVQCKLCAKTCPTAAIDFDDCTITIAEKCIKCCSCVRKCPQKAKEFNHPGYKKMQEMLAINFSAQQKKPELYFAEKQ